MRVKMLYSDGETNLRLNSISLLHGNNNNNSFTISH